MTGKTWDDKSDYMRNIRPIHHNDDYLEFLVTSVWRLDRFQSLVDFGCGFGWLGTKLLPLLPERCTYTGVDRSRTLLDEAEREFAELSNRVKFYESQVYDTPFESDSFDVAICHAVMQHLEQPERALDEMVRVTRPGGLVISCDACVNAHNAMFNIAETNELDNTPLGFLQTLMRRVREVEASDYNIGSRMAMLLHRKGLGEVQARVTDRIAHSFPPIETDEERRTFEAICSEGYGGDAMTDEEVQRRLARLVSLGLPREEAEVELARERTRGFARNGVDWHIACPSLLTWSWGTVP